MLITTIPENPLHLSTSAYCPQGKDERIRSGSSIARAFKTHSEQGVVFSLFSASQQSIRKRYPAVVAMSMLLWCMLYSAYRMFILFVPSLLKYYESISISSLYPIHIVLYIVTDFSLPYF